MTSHKFDPHPLSLSHTKIVVLLTSTYKQQHGFRKNKSIAAAGLLLQSIISRALYDDNYVAMTILLQV